jgi:hypothetical protein
MSGVRQRAGRVAAIVAAWLVMSVGVAQAADAPREVHGAADAYAEPGIALAWGVQRGADEASTRVTLRVVADPARYPRLAVIGRDPFTQTERVVQAARSTAGLPDLVIPRAHFADFPRTELRFFAPGGAEAPVVVVYYLGVPDTTPEFAAAAALDRYLGERIARARAATGEK